MAIIEGFLVLLLFFSSVEGLIKDMKDFEAGGCFVLLFWMILHVFFVEVSQVLSGNQ